nr:MAG: hypothetical protein [Bacteriophage sp.]
MRKKITQENPLRFLLRFLLRLFYKFSEFLDFCAESKSTKAKAAQKSTFLSGFLELVTGVEPATH